jgi:hypothetical protein
MFNVKGEVRGDELIVTIGLASEARAAAQPSQSGKTRLLFGDVAVSLNATIKPER